MAIISCGLQAQTTQQLVEAFEKYQTKWPEQRVHLTLNQPKYAPGDTIFFKTYLFGNDLSLWSGSQIVEINLIDSEGHMISEALIKTDNGTGQNQLILPQNIETGFYKLTAFTNWMRNLGTDYMYQNEIMIVRNEALEKAQDNLKFEIEGGNLISGTLSNLVIKTAKAKADVYLKSQDGALVDSVQTDRLGFAQIKFVPQFGNTYLLEVEGKSLNVAQVQSSGYNITVSPSNSYEEDLKLLISGQLSSNETDQLTFIISSKGKIVYHESLPGNQPKIGRSISKEKLSPGLYHMSLLNGQGELLSSREFYIGSVQVNESIRIKAQPDVVSPRSAVDLNVQLFDGFGNPTKGEFSISVQNANVLNVNAWTLEEQILLQNRVDFTWQAHNDEKKNLIDQALILANRKVDWSGILSTKPKEQVYNNNSLFQLTGFAKDSIGTPLPYNSLLMFYLQNDLMRYEVKSSVNGYFELNLFDIYGEDELFIMAETPNGDEILNVQIDWLEKPVPSFKAASKAINVGDIDAYGAFADKRQKVDHSFDFFSTSTNLDSLAESKRGRAPKAAILDVDFTMDVEDFYLFPSMAEFVKETVRPLRVGREDGKDVVRVKFLEPGTNADPLYIIDGIATKNTSFFLSLVPADLKTIQAIKYPKKLSRFGEMAKNGIVIVNTKTGTVREPIDLNHVILGLNRPIGFKVLDEDWANQSDRPEFRSTVYWEPAVKTDSNGEATVQFYTSDDTAPLTIRIDGFANGKPFTISKTIATEKAAGQ